MMKILNFIAKIISIIFLGNGSYFSFTNMNNENLNLPGSKYHFHGIYTYKSSIDEYKELIKKIKRLEIFSYKVNDINVKTIIHRNNSDQDVQLDDEIAVTTASLTDWLFTTSFEKVCALNETENSFFICIAANSQNVIDGYYRLSVVYKDDEITIDYAKIQNTITWFFKLIVFIFKKNYINMNIESVKNTINFLSKKEEFKIENVKLEIK